MGIQQILPETGETLIELSTQPVGQLRFACGMGMYSGVIEFVESGALAPIQPQTVTRILDPESQVAPALACDPAIATCQPPGAMLRIVPAAAPETVTGPVLPAAVGAQPEASDGAQTINISLVNGAYTPARSRAKAGLPSKLLVHTQNGYG